MMLGYTLEKNNWYLILMCLVLDAISIPLLFAKFLISTLFSQTFDTGHTLCKAYFTLVFNSKISHLAATNYLLPCVYKKIYFRL